MADMLFNVSRIVLPRGAENNVNIIIINEDARSQLNTNFKNT